MTPEIIHVFLTEARELTQQLEAGLLEIDDDQTVEDDTVNALFRVAHTIKGSAGVVGLTDIVTFTHSVEAVFERIRAKEISLEIELVNILLKCNDHISTLLDLAEEDTQQDNDTIKKGEQLVLSLQHWLVDESEGSSETDEIDNSDSADIGVFSAEKEILLIVFPEACFYDGIDPLSMIRFLKQQQPHPFELERWHDQLLPSIDKLDQENSEKCFLIAEIHTTKIPPEVFESTFEFILNNSKILRFSGDIRNQYEDTIKILENKNLETYFLELWDDERILPPKVVNLEKVSDISTKSEKKDKKKSLQKDTRIMRVPAFKLDDLVNQLGELVIASAGLQERSRHIPSPELSEISNQIQMLVDDVQSVALQLRMVQIGETFNRFKRVVRDVAEQLDKKVKLEISGADTELDKSMVEGISDPLMHLIRNALDHGIETPKERLASEKSEVSTLELSAYHDSGFIVIEIKDDGKGINREKVLEKAIANGLVTEDAMLSDSEIDALIFEAGFSTADGVSNLSGRGVGMDVVNQNIQALRGTVEIKSTPGIGTQFFLRLPLTLAIIDGFLVRVGNAMFVIPLDLVVECIELPNELQSSERHSDYINLRDEVMPFLYLNKVFELPLDLNEKRSIVVVKHGASKSGFVVDEVLGEFQTVIKPLGKLFEFMDGVSGSSILGSGEIALILDIPKLVTKSSVRKESTSTNLEVIK